MTAYSVVRFRVNPGQESEFETIYAACPRNFAGARNVALIRDEFNDEEEAGDVQATLYFAVGEWETYDDIRNAREQMMQNRERFAHTLVRTGKATTKALSGTAIYEARASAR